MGAHSSCSWSGISSISSSGSRASRSILLMKVTMGMSRRRQTSNNLRVCASMPLAASITMTAESAAVSVRYVSSEKSSWPGVSSRLNTAPPYSNVITALVTEMPRSCSIFIQSDFARRASPRAFTAPAARMAPPSSSRCSVSVVLPASGCEMMAKVRRRAASAAGVPACLMAASLMLHQPVAGAVDPDKRLGITALLQLVGYHYQAEVTVGHEFADIVMAGRAAPHPFLAYNFIVVRDWLSRRRPPLDSNARCH